MPMSKKIKKAKTLKIIFLNFIMSHKKFKDWIGFFIWRRPNVSYPLTVFLSLNRLFASSLVVEFSDCNWASIYWLVQKRCFTIEWYYFKEWSSSENINVTTLSLKTSFMDYHIKLTTIFIFFAWRYFVFWIFDEVFVLEFIFVAI